jgi:hypothetical protein
MYIHTLETYIRTYIFKCMHIHVIHTFMHTYSSYVHVCICTYKHAYIPTCIQILQIIHIHTYIYIHKTQYNTTQHYTIQYNTIQHNTTQHKYNTIQHMHRLWPAMHSLTSNRIVHIDSTSHTCVVHAACNLREQASSNKRQRHC